MYWCFVLNGLQFKTAVNSFQPCILCLCLFMLSYLSIWLLNCYHHSRWVFCATLTLQSMDGQITPDIQNQWNLRPCQGVRVNPLRKLHQPQPQCGLKTSLLDLGLSCFYSTCRIVVQPLCKSATFSVSHFLCLVSSVGKYDVEVYKMSWVFVYSAWTKTHRSSTCLP